MNIVERVRKALNVTSNAFDDELRDVVEAARRDMEMSGVPRRVARDENAAGIGRLCPAARIQCNAISRSGLGRTSDCTEAA